MLRALSVSNACLTRNEPYAKRVGGVELGPTPPKLRCSWHCTQPRVAKATKDVAVVGKTSSIPRAAAIRHRMIHGAAGSHHSTQASVGAVGRILLCGTWYGFMGVRVFRGGIGDAMGP